jgi:hypothetical protein
MLSNLFVENGHEVHVLTGSIETEAIHEELRGYGISWTHFYSIADHNKKIGTPMTYDGNGDPWMSSEDWNRSKGDYCREHGIDLCIDDTVGYGDYFTTPFSRFFSKHIPLSVREIKSPSDFNPNKVEVT